MQFVLSCLLYAFIGSFVGLVVHIINGAVHHKIVFNRTYVTTVLRNFARISLVWLLAVLVTATGISLIPHSFLVSIGAEKKFLEDLVFYLYAFAAFDFTHAQVVEKKS